MLPDTSAWLLGRTLSQVNSKSYGMLGQNPFVTKLMKRKRRSSGNKVLRQKAYSILIGLTLLIPSGCDTLPKKHAPHSKACPCGQASCLPVSTSHLPPAAGIDVAQRCTDRLPKDAVPAPAGVYVSQWRGAMSYGSQEQHWVVTRNEWFDGGSQLGPKGQQHVQRIVQCHLAEPHVVVIETEPVALEMHQSYEDALQSNQRLQLDRRNVVVTALANAGVPDADQWVVFAEDRSVGVRGIEAPQVFNSQFGGGGRGNRGGIGRGQGGMGGGMGGGLGGGGMGGGLGGGMGGGGGIF